MRRSSAIRTPSRTTGSRSAVILDNGVIRTLDPSLPTCGALAIAGPLVAGGVGTHEWALPTPERVNLAGRCVLPAFTDSHVHFPTWALARHDVRLEEAGSLQAALALVAAHPRRGTWIRGTGWRDAAWPEAPTAAALDAVTGRHPGSTVVEGLPLALAQHGRPRSGRAATSRSPAASSSAAPTASPPGSCARSRPGASATASSRSPRTSGSTRRGRGSGSRTPAAWPRSTTRTAGSARPRSSAGSTSRRDCRCASGSRCRPTGCPRSRRCRCARASATTSCGSAT